MPRSVFASLAVVAWLLAVSAHAKPAANVALSNDLLAQANVALAANKQTEALDLYEAAALANPGSPAPYVGMARAYEALGLQGKALRYYREALELNPNDVSVLEAQAMLMIAKGNMDKAQACLARIKKLCAKTPCAAIARVDAALAKARTQTSMNGRVAPQRIVRPTPVAKPAAKPRPQKK